MEENVYFISGLTLLCMNFAWLRLQTEGKYIGMFEPHSLQTIIKLCLHFNWISAIFRKAHYLVCVTYSAHNIRCWENMFWICYFLIVSLTLSEMEFNNYTLFPNTQTLYQRAFILSESFCLVNRILNNFST